MRTVHTTLLPHLTYHPLERLPIARPVDRYEYVAERCRGCRVLDLGAYDETEATRPQHSSWRWLHAEIAKTASAVLGIDASASLPPTGIETRVGTRIVPGTVEDLSEAVVGFSPDLIVAGELIEHTSNTLGWLSQLARLAPGVPLLLTTPNATSAVNLLLAILGRENNHQDHVQIYSYKTLATLASRVPIRNPSLVPYFYDPHIFRGRLPAFFAPIVSAVDLLVLRPFERVFPLTAFGWILEGVLDG
jgi:hypothetical protein